MRRKDPFWLKFIDCNSESYFHQCHIPYHASTGMRAERRRSTWSPLAAKMLQEAQRSCPPVDGSLPFNVLLSPELLQLVPRRKDFLRTVAANALVGRYTALHCIIH